MFRFLGVLLALYTIYAIAKGEVYCKDGLGGKTVCRRDSPDYFWIVIVIYGGLSLALLFWF